MVGYCGIDCTECAARKATLKGDRKELERVAAKFAEGAYEPGEWVCLGCGVEGTEPFLARYCFGCRIRSCARKRAVPNCAACDEFEGCSMIQDFIKAESPTLPDTMSWLRERYLANRSVLSDKEAGRI